MRLASGDIPAFPAEPVDATGAGDAFVGALAVALAEGASLDEASRSGAAAGACAVEAGRRASFPAAPRRRSPALMWLGDPMVTRC